MENLLADIQNPVLGDFGNQTGEKFLSGIFGGVIEVIFVISVVAFLIMLFFGGIKMMTSKGDKQGTEGSRSILTNAFIGLLIVLLFYTFLSLIECFFGFGFRQFSVGPFEISPISTPVCKNKNGGTPPPGGGTTGNAACSGCINGGCGITGQVYLGAGSTNYRCTTSGWQSTGSAVTSTNCPACP
jgi:hypothetical protein